MADFTINVLELEEEPFGNEPTIAFFNVFRGMYPTFENTPNMAYKKINSEVLLRDIIKANGAIELSSGDINISDNTPAIQIEMGTIINPNTLSKVAFIFKESYFEDGTIGQINPGALPSDLISIRSGGSFNPITYSTIGNITEYDIQDLNNLFIKNYDADTFFQNCVRGYIDLLYNFRTSNTTFDETIENWSVLRIQFGFGDNGSSLTKPYYFNIINFVRKSDYINETINSETYPIEYLKGTDYNGDLIPIYYYGQNNITEIGSGLEVVSRTHTSGVSATTVLPLVVDTENHHPLNSLSGEYNISALERDDNIPVNIPEILVIDGVPFGISEGSSRYGVHHIFGILEDTDYIPLIG